MTLLRTSVLNGLATALRILAMLGLNKILALYVGPSGYVVIGQFQNAMSIVLSFGSGGINAGVTKMTAERFDDPQGRTNVWRTAFAISAALIGSVAIVLAAASPWISGWVLEDSSYWSVVLIFALMAPLFVLNNFLLSIVNGLKNIRMLVTINIASSVVSLAVTGALVVVWGLYGALVGLAINQSIVCLATVALCWRETWLQRSNFLGAIDWKIATGLGGYAGFTLVAALLSPLTLILIRDGLVSTVGLHDTGYWEAVWRISSAYQMFLTMTLGVYFLPRFAELRSAASLYRELRTAYLFLIPLTLALSLGIFLTRDLIIWLLLSPDFAPASNYFAWQLVGDSLKLGSWILSYLLLARGKLVALTILEVTGSAIFYGSYLYLADQGINAATKAYTINYAVYWACTAAACWWYFIRKDEWAAPKDAPTPESPTTP